MDAARRIFDCFCATVLENGLCLFALYTKFGVFARPVAEEVYLFQCSVNDEPKFAEFEARCRQSVVTPRRIAAWLERWLTFRSARDAESIARVRKYAPMPLLDTDRVLVLLVMRDGYDLAHSFYLKDTDARCSFRSSFRWNMAAVAAAANRCLAGLTPARAFVSDELQARAATRLERRRCAACAAPARARCSACLLTMYCSSTCQHADWRRHRTRCALARYACVKWEMLAAGFALGADDPWDGATSSLRR